MKMRKYILLPRLAIIAITVFAFTSCQDLLEQRPPDTGSNVPPEEAIQTGKDLKELLNSAYDVLGNTYNGTFQNLPTLLSDNLERPQNQDNYVSVWLRRSTIFNADVAEGYKQHYIAILRANTVLENLDNVWQQRFIGMSLPYYI